MLCNEPGYEYQWYLDGNPIDSAISQFLIPFQNGVYQVSSTDFHDCEVFSDSLSINILSVTEDRSKLMFYPNPSSTGELNIEISKISNLSVFNMSGKIVFSKTLNKGINHLKTNLYKGLYFLHLESDGMREIKKWIVL